ncbi:tripartite ATP-independent transporter DctM subunit [Mangrovibacter plantisponsor]|uniref:Tripartite ATP-independent transporter DctM subunit n=1 Tax=Mangrovibacter plantisponsor TaxID=451513 RepID=A0A317Q7K0_9ENTR|nr:tripartite ATP-independent transporter DctM subunit [Mangrovibacter plantisponsor]
MSDHRMNQTTTPSLAVPPASLAASRLQRIEQILSRVLSCFMVCLLAAMSLLIIYSVITRYFFQSPSSLSEELLRFSLIWLGLIGAALCFNGTRHLSLPILFDRAGATTQRWMMQFNNLLVIAFGVILLAGGWLAMEKNGQMLTPMLKVSVGMLHGAVVLCGAFMIIHRGLFALRELGCSRRTLLESLVCALSLAVILFAISQFATTSLWESLVYDHLEATSLLILFSTFFLFLAMNTPIAIGLALSGLFTLALQIAPGDLLAVVGEKMFSGLDSFGFLALPFFILAGNIMNQGGIARRLLDLALLLGKRIPGNLWQSNIIANMLFGSLSGSAIAASTAIGGIVAPMAKEKGYDMAFTTAVNASSAPTGMLIPPTGVFIMYSLITGGSASIAALFLAGYLPGIMMGLAVMIVAGIWARRHNYPVDKSPWVWQEISQVLIRALPSLSLVVVIIGGIIGGVFTATEGAGVAVAWSLMLGLVYRTLSMKKLVKVLAESAITSAVILFLIACSGLMSWSMTFANIPDTIGELLISVSDNKFVILLLITLTLLVVGVFMDMTPAMLIFTPILYPVVTELGMSPVQFGVVLTYNLAIGIVTPPVGTVLFVSCSITGEKVTRVIRPLLPIFAMQLVGLLLITWFPFFTLWLPGLFGL